MISLLLYAACTGPSPEPSAPQRPQSTPVRVQLGSDGPPPLPELAEPDALQAVVPALTDLEQLELYLAVGVMNLVPGPCVPCIDDRTLGVCLLDPPPGCENIGALAVRAAEMAKAGVDQKELRAALSYGDSWFPDATAVDTPDAVDVELWLKPGSMGSADVFAQVEAVRAEAGDFTLHIRAIGDSQTDLLGRGLIAAVDQGKAAAYMAAAPSLPEDIDRDGLVDAAASMGLSREAFATVLDGAKVNSDVIRSKGVRSSPTWFVEGYRLRGLQSVDSIGRLVKLETPQSTPSPPEP